MRLLIVVLLIPLLYVSTAQSQEEGSLTMPKDDEPKATITLDQTDVQPGDTITFTTAGEHKNDDISVQVFPASGNPEGTGPIWSERQQVGTPFTLPTDKWEGPFTLTANLERHGGQIAETSFETPVP